MTVKELKDMIKDYDDEKNVVFVSCSGMGWDIDITKTFIKNATTETPNQVVAYIK